MKFRDFIWKVKAWSWGANSSPGRSSGCLAAFDSWGCLLIARLGLSPPAPALSCSCVPCQCSGPSQRKAPRSPVVLGLSLQPASSSSPPPHPPTSGSAERGRELLGRMSALGAGHSAGGGCDVAAAVGPAKVLGTKEAELPGALRQMWRSRSWDVPQIPAEGPQTQ